MSVHTDWLKNLEKWKQELKQKTGKDFLFPPPSNETLQVEYTAIDPGKRMVAQFPYQKKFSNPVGLYQGGFLSAAIDEVLGPLAYITAGTPCMTLSLNVTYLRAFPESMGHVVVEGTVLQKTKSLLFLRAEVRSPAGDLIAHAESHATSCAKIRWERVFEMKELAYKVRQKFLDRLINFYGPYLGAGVRLVHMSKDFREARVEMPLTIYNRNYVGTQFGGSLYAMTDPWYMLMLIKNLGPAYIVWDKGATIDFKKPGRTKVRAEFKLTQELIDQIKAEVDQKVKVYWPFKVEILDEENTVIATVEKIVYVRKKSDITKNNQTAR